MTDLDDSLKKSIRDCARVALGTSIFLAVVGLSVLIVSMPLLILTWPAVLTAAGGSWFFWKEYHRLQAELVLMALNEMAE